MSANNVELIKSTNTIQLVSCTDGGDSDLSKGLLPGQSSFIDCSEAKTISIQDVFGVGTDLKIESSMAAIRNNSTESFQYNWVEERLSNYEHLFLDEMVTKVTADAQHMTSLKVTNNSSDKNALVIVSMVLNKG